MTTNKTASLTQNKLVLVPAAIAILVILIVSFNWLLDKREEYAFQKITLNAKESIVIAEMGAPVAVTACGDDLWWGDDALGKNDGRCVQEAHYEHLFHSWAVGYSKDKHVVAKRHYSGQKS